MKPAVRKDRKGMRLFSLAHETVNTLRALVS